MPTTPPTLPDARGYFGDFGGNYVPETLHAALVPELPASRLYHWLAG